jgi:hypothetical protein
MLSLLQSFPERRLAGPCSSRTQLCRRLAVAKRWAGRLE